MGTYSCFGMLARESENSNDGKRNNFIIVEQATHRKGELLLRDQPWTRKQTAVPAGIAQALEQLVALLGKVIGVQPCWRKHIIAGWLCWLITSSLTLSAPCVWIEMRSLSFLLLLLATLPCRLHGSYPSGTINQIKVFLLPLLLAPS